MKSLFSRLFGTRSQLRRGATRTVRRTTRPGLERLEDRLIPSVTPSLVNGQLRFVGDGGNDSAVVTTGFTSVGSGPVNVLANFSDGTTFKTWSRSSVASLYFSSGGGTDTFTNYSNIDATFDGRGGVTTMTGGSGKNTFFTDGDDRINPNGTQNTTFGLVNNLTQADLAAQGAFAASLSVDHTTLTLSGPGGAGFRLAGNWQDITLTSPTTHDIIRTAGTVTMKSPLGDIPIPTGAAGISFTLAPSNFTGAGVVNAISIASFPLMVNTSGPFAALSNELGLNVSLPDVSWGISLGSNLGNLNVPVNPGVPYLYASVNTGFSIQLGNGPSISSSGGKSMAIAIDPSDPSIVVRYNDFAAGGSLNGRIPFTPVTQPSGFSDTIYGQLYGAGSIDLGEYPATISGSAVINLDPNHTGHVLGISGDTFHQLLTGKLKASQLEVNALNNEAIGINGTLSLGYDKDGFNFSLPVANATLMYEPGILAFRGDQPNLFAGTPLDSIVPASLQDTLTGPRYFVDGSIAWDGGVKDWHLTAGVDNLVLGGSFRASHAQFTIDNSGVHAVANIDGMLGLAHINVTGDVFFDGGYDLKFTSNADFNVSLPSDVQKAMSDAGINLPSAHASFGFDLEHTGGSSTTTFTASLSGSVDNFHIPLVGDIENASAGGTLTITKDSTGVHVSGSGSGSLTFDPSIGSKKTYSISFDASASSLTIHTPSGLPDITVHWNGVVFYDVNGDGVQDHGEPGLSGYKVYLDLDNDGKWEPGEPMAVSDATGAYSFGQLPAGKFVARVILPNGNIVLTNPFDSDVFDPSKSENTQYHFGLRGVNAAGRQQLAATLRQQLAHQTAGVDFWTSRKGQALINSLNDGPTSTQLGDWLAATLPNLYGAGAGTHDLDGKSNSDIASFEQQLRSKHLTLDAEVLATALSVYVTSSNLAGTTASTYGFHVSDGGVGTMSIDVGKNGAAAGSNNSSVMTIMDVLLATDRLSSSANGILYGGSTKLRSQADALYSAINNAGMI
jgi:hypothetical protein